MSSRRRLRSGTLRSRLTVLSTALVALVLLVGAFALVVVQQQLLIRGVDEALLQRADNVQAGVAREAPGSVLPGEGDREDSFLQLIDDNGRVVAASANVASLPSAVGALPAGRAPLFRTISITRLSSHDYRVLAQPVASGLGARTLLVGKNVDDVKDSVHVLTSSLAVSIPVVLVLLGTLLWWLTGSVLRPVEAIRGEVAGISGSALHRRVPVQPRDDEISRLARTMNAMLERVQQATDQQRQFVADASHELRGPLTRIRSGLEIGLAHPDDMPAQQVYRELLTDTTDLQQLIDDLLFLARSESGVPARPHVTVDLDDLVLEAASRLRTRGQVNVDTSRVGAARVSGDVHQLARALGNLASNAERHATTTVTFELSEVGGRSQLVVSDDGPGIPTQHRQAVFTRFTRLDQSRSREAGGAGLGLAIVHDIITRHHGDIVISGADPHGARVAVSLPSTP